MEIVRTVSDYRSRLRVWRRAGESTALVPTMGALHDGHLSLVRRAIAEADHAIATLFVNPKQFSPREDLQQYPRDEAADVEMFSAAGVELLFVPTVDEIYPDGFATRVHVDGLGDILEGEYRPGFFTGVATVVTKLLVQAMPDKAIFGEKDYQQLLVIRCLARDIDLPVEIVGGETVRDADGLALSSRNAYLSADERAQAPAFHAALVALADAVAAGDDPVSASAAATQSILSAGFAEVEYVTVRDAETLSENLRPGYPGRVLGAVRLGQTRLIDNVPVPA